MANDLEHLSMDLLAFHVSHFVKYLFTSFAYIYLRYLFFIISSVQSLSRVRLCVTPQKAATRLPRAWESPGNNTGVGCHFLLQCMKVKSEVKYSIH